MSGKELKKKYYTHVYSDMDLDEKYDFGYHRGVNGKNDHVHTPDVECETGWGRDLNFGVQKYQHKAQDHGTINSEHHEVNKGRPIRFRRRRPR